MPTRPSLSPGVSALLAVAAGALVGMGQAPMGVWPATIAGVALFTWLMVGRSGRAAVGLGYLAGATLNVLTVSWISVLGVGVAVALIVFISLWWGLLGWVVSRLTRLPAWPFLVPTAWIAMEFASGKIPFGGFSWTRLAYTAVDQPMSGYLAWVGVAGVAYLIAFVAQILLLAVTAGRALRLKALAGALAVFALGGLLNWTPLATPDESVTIAMVQPNVNRSEKGTGSYARSVSNNALSETIFAMALARSGDGSSTPSTTRRPGGSSRPPRGSPRCPSSWGRSPTGHFRTPGRPPASGGIRWVGRATSTTSVTSCRSASGPRSATSCCPGCLF